MICTCKSYTSAMTLVPTAIAAVDVELGCIEQSNLFAATSFWIDNKSVLFLKHFMIYLRFF